MEAMSSELMVSALWELDGFLTLNRIPIRVQGGWSDIDVIGVNWKRHVRMAECKIRGSAREVLAIPDGKAFVGFLHRHETGIDEMHERDTIFSMLPVPPKEIGFFFPECDQPRKSSLI